jgi:hypothetical protein
MAFAGDGQPRRPIVSALITRQPVRDVMGDALVLDAAGVST